MQLKGMCRYLNKNIMQILEFIL